MHESVITVLGTLLFIGGMAATLFRSIGLSATPAYLLAGMCFASFQRFIPEDWQLGHDSVHPYMDLGLMLLMFGAGLDLSSAKIRKLGTATLSLGLIQSLGTAALAFLVWGILKGFDQSATIMGMALAFSSTGGILQYFEDRHLMRQAFAKNVVGVLLIEDLLAIFAIICLPVLAGQEAHIPFGYIASELLLITSVLWFAGGIIGPRLTWLGLRRGGAQLLLVLSLGLCLMTGMIFAQVQLSSALGAFIIGMLLAETTEISTIRSMVTPVRQLFVAVFFVAFGMQFQISELSSGVISALYLLPVLFIGKFFIPLVIGLWNRKSLFESFHTALSLPQVGEFSIIIASSAATLGIVTQESLSTVMVLCLITLSVIPLVMNVKEKVFARLETSPFGEYSHRFQRQGDRFREGLSLVFSVGKAKETSRFQFVLDFFSETYRKTRVLSKTSQLAKITPWGEHLTELVVEAGSPAVGQTVMELGLRQSFAINLVAIERDGEVYVSPEPNFRILPWDVAIVYGTDEQIAKAEMIFHRSEKKKNATGTKLADCVLREMDLKADHQFVGHTIKELHLRSAHGMMVLAVMRNETRERNPNPDFRFQIGDKIFYVATRSQGMI